MLEWILGLLNSAFLDFGVAGFVDVLGCLIVGCFNGFLDVSGFGDFWILAF